jgi:hypothetical protein
MEGLEEDLKSDLRGKKPTRYSSDEEKPFPVYTSPVTRLALLRLIIYKIKVP